MARLDTATLEHLAQWCNKQFPDDHKNAVFNRIAGWLETLEQDERQGYLNNSWWHAYDGMAS
jgi:hypothetical protein